MLSDKTDLTQSTSALRRRIEELERWYQAQERQIRFLERERQKLSALVNHTDAGVVVFDTSLSVVWFNNVCRVWFASGAQASIGSKAPCRELLCRSEQTCADCPAAAALATGSVSHREMRLDLGERPRQIYVTAMPMKTPDNHVDQCILMLQDLTDLEVLKRSQEEMLQAKEAAEAANRAKGEFLANMSHEVRTPLTCILSVSSHLEETTLSGEQQECVGMIQRSGKSLLTIINDILDFSRIEAGRLAIDPVPFDLAAMVDDMAGLVAEKAEEKGIELIVRYGRDIPSRVVGDVGRIRQALMNLVANAIKFTHTGHVLIDVAKLATDDTSVTLQFTVEDTGIGIPADKLSSVFDKFTQADGSITRCYGGTGLGLAIAKQLVELMHGTIGVSSTVDSGSTFMFTLTLPLMLGAPATLAGDDLAGLRVLVLHGHEKVRSVAGQLIAGWNSRAHGVATGSEAIVALRTAHDEGDPFHLAIIARDIADMQPEALATVICTDPALRSTALVLTTTLRQRRDVQWLRAAGFDAYLTCPLRPSQIANALAVARPRQR